MSKVKRILDIEKEDKCILLSRISLTYMLSIINKSTCKIDSRYLFQLSTKDMFWIPKRVDYEEGYTLFGWLFIYFGCDTNMLKRRM